MFQDGQSLHSQSSRQPLNPQSNGTYHPPRPNMSDAHHQHYEDEQGYLVPNQVSDLHRSGSDMTANGSDPDSVLEYYKTDGQNGGRSASRTVSNKDRKRKKSGTKRDIDEVEKDDRYWIHRDKLKEIESRELIEAGFQVGRSSRSNSKSQSASRQARDRNNSETRDPRQNGDDRADYPRMVSPIPAADEEDETGGQTHWGDLRTPEEIEAEKIAWSTPPVRTTHVIRPSTSRIPIAKTSPAPVPHAFVERDAPLPRSRTGSMNWSGDALEVRGARVRSGSTSSQVLLDEPSRGTGERLRTPEKGRPGNFNSPTTSSPLNGSPPKAKTPGKLNPTSGGRKTSAQRPTSSSKPSPRAIPGTSPGRRPGTSGGSIARPTTGHKPEGEAPWIATMYKPDPRLPPDQQIIPTHAKRIAQEQWETEGKTGSIYDRDFRLLNTDEFKNKRASQIEPLELQNFEKMADEEHWPLPSPTKPTFERKPTAERNDTNMKSPTNEQSSYKLTPTIPQSPRVLSRAASRTSVHPLPPTTSNYSPPKPQNITRVTGPPEEAKEKKGCCCIVM